MTTSKKRNDQIKNTKRRLGLNNSHGLLILANTSNQPLEPEFAQGFLSFLFNKRKTKDGPPICSSIDCVLYLPQIHMVGRLPDGGGLLPPIPVFRDERPEYEPLRTYLRYTFLKEWAAFNGQRYFVSDQPFSETQRLFKNTVAAGRERQSRISGVGLSKRTSRYLEVAVFVERLWTLKQRDISGQCSIASLSRIAFSYTCSAQPVIRSLKYMQLISR